MMGREHIMLCYPFEYKRFKSWGNRALVQPKLDGLRCRCVIDEMGLVTLYSSQGNVIKSVPHINEAIDDYGYTNLELDGELYVHDMAFQNITSIVKRTTSLHPDYKNVEFHIFDIVTVGKQRDRLTLLDSLFKSRGEIQLVPTSIALSEEDIHHEVERWLMQGYEGIVLRALDAPYVRKRSTKMMKMKPMREDCYRIVGMEEEVDIHGKLKGTLGAFVLESHGQHFKVGTGFTRDQRQALWLQDGVIGKYCLIKYQELTNRGVPRFPVLLGIGNEEPMEDE